MKSDEWACLEAAFPFAFRWNADQELVFAGRSLRRACDWIMPGMKLSGLFELQRPAGPFDSSWLALHQGKPLLVLQTGTGMLMRGQALLEPDGGGVFLGTPWVSTPDDLTRHGLTQADFAPHDPIQDLLQMVQAHQTAQDELKILNARLKAQQQILAERESEAMKLALLAARMESGVIIASSTGEIEWTNARFEQQTGWTLQEARGHQIKSFLQGPRTDPKTVAEMGRRLQHAEELRTEVLLYHKNGMVFWAHWEMLPVIQANGTLTHFMVLQSDISEKKRREMRRRLETCAATVLAASPAHGEVIPMLLKALAVKFGWPKAGYWEVDGSGQHLVLRETWYQPNGNLEDFVRAAKATHIHKEQGLPGLVWAEGRAHWSTNLRSSSKFLREKAAADYGLNAALAFPVHADGEVRGVLEFYSFELESPDPDLLECLMSIGGQIGILLGRLEAQHALRRGESAISMAERLAQVGFWQMDFDSERIEWSDEQYRIHGYEPGSVAVSLEFCRQAILEEDVESTMAAIETAISNSEPVEFTYRIRRPDGVVRHLRSQVRPEWDEKGVAVSLSGVVLDVTESVMAAQRLKEAEESWQAAIQKNGLGVWDWNIESGVQLCNDQLQRMLGYEPGEGAQNIENWTQRVHPDDLPTVMEEVRSCLAGEKPDYLSEHRLLCKAGGWKWVQDTGRVVSFAEDGSPLRMIGTMMDIHVSKLAREAAERRVEMLNRIRSAQERFIQSQDMASVFAEMLKIGVSHTGSGFGFIGEVLYDDEGKPYLRTYAINDISWDEASRQLMKSAERGGLEFRNLQTLFGAALVSEEVIIANQPSMDPRASGLPPGHPPLDSFLGVPIFSGLEMVGLLGLANRAGGYSQDMLNELDPYLAACSSMITARRESERNRRIESELRRARDRAEAANRAKSDFLAMISHEIRTPMNGVLGMAGMLRFTQLDNRQQELVEMVLQSGNALMSIIDDILDFSKVEAGQMPLHENAVELRTLVEGVVDMLALEAAGKGLEIVAVVPPELPRRIRGDEGRLRQVLLNLAGNAIKFTEEGGVTIRVLPVEGGIEFQVEDTGIGIAEEHRARLFRPFSQVDSSRSRRHGGAGLGLAISKKLMRQMGGEIGVESDPGEGCLFWIRLPLNQEALEEIAAFEPSQSSQRDPEPRRIWLASPSSRVRECLGSSLQSPGLQLLEFKDEEMLLRSFRGEHPACDALIVDTAWSSDETQTAIEDWLARLAKADLTPRVFWTGFANNEFIPSEQHVFLRLPMRRAALRRSVLILEGESVSDEEGADAAPGPISGQLGLKVLVAEDNLINARLAMMLLDSFGCPAEWVLNGAEAVSAFERLQPDVVLMDCQMPVMDGYEATRRIRQLEQASGDGRHCRIIAMTANALLEKHQRSFEAGMDAHMSKPFDAADLFRLLESAVGEKGAVVNDNETSGDPRLMPQLISQIGEKAAQELVTIWLKEAPKRLGNIETEFGLKRPEAAAKDAHALRGASSIFGLHEVMDACLQIEKTVKDGLELKAGHVQRLSRAVKDALSQFG